MDNQLKEKSFLRTLVFFISQSRVSFPTTAPLVPSAPSRQREPPFLLSGEWVPPSLGGFVFLFYCFFFSFVFGRQQIQLFEGWFLLICHCPVFFFSSQLVFLLACMQVAFLQSSQICSSLLHVLQVVELKFKVSYDHRPKDIDGGSSERFNLKSTIETPKSCSFSIHVDINMIWTNHNVSTFSCLVVVGSSTNVRIRVGSSSPQFACRCAWMWLRRQF